MSCSYNFCLLSASQIDDYLLLFAVLLEELANDLINGFHSKPISTIDEWRAPLWLFDEVAEEMGFVGKVKTLDTALRHNAAVICLS